MPLHPDALVALGGENRDPEKIRDKALRAHKRGKGYVISVVADIRCTDDGPGLSLLEVCGPPDRPAIPHGKVQVSTAERLTSAGFELILDISDGQPLTHHHVVLKEPLEQSAALFIQSFDEPAPKPVDDVQEGSQGP